VSDLIECLPASKASLERNGGKKCYATAVFSCTPNEDVTTGDRMTSYKATASPKAAKTACRAVRLMLFSGLGIIFVLGFYNLWDLISLDSLARHHQSLIGFKAAHYTLSICLFVLAYSLIVALSFPGAMVASLTGGLLFGLYLGTFLNVIAASLGAIALFFAVRTGVGERLKNKISSGDGQIARLQAELLTHEWSVLFMVRLVPAVPFFLTNLILAIVGVKFHRFAISTALGILPGAVVYTSIGAGLSQIFAAGHRPDLSVIFAPHILMPILGLASLAALPIVMSFFQKKRTQ
jgi:uncharacterized membrane protein YdjX (TVP38/TMEM64 family)